jgi:aryl-alcohol dehydrogenase-like predicted oxidoreductase
VLAELDRAYRDLLPLHRPDTLVEPEEVAAAFETLKTAGKQPLIVNQVQLSITTRRSSLRG